MTWTADASVGLYPILRPLREGGLAAVWGARESRPERDVRVMQ